METFTLHSRGLPTRLGTLEEVTVQARRKHALHHDFGW